VAEYDFNRRQALEIEEALHTAGFTGSFLLDPEGVGLGLRERPSRAAALGADLLVSVHHDSVQEVLLDSWSYGGEQRPYCDEHQGFCLFVSRRGGQPQRSEAAARTLGYGLVAEGLEPSLYHALPLPNEGMTLLEPGAAVFRRDGLAVLAHASLPAVLLECGMIINRLEEAQLNDSAHRRRISEAVVCGAESLCGVWSGAWSSQR